MTFSFFLLPNTALAGAENVFVVVNARSWASITVANQYCRLRQIDDNHVFYLDWPGSWEGTDIVTFRQKLLHRITAEIDRRRLANQIDTILYSSDFPFKIDFSADRNPQAVRTENQKKLEGNFGSLTGMTYLSQAVAQKSIPAYTSLRSNFYYRALVDGVQKEPTRHLSSRYVWGVNGERRLDRQGLRYIGSAMLAVTSGQGNSLAEVFGYLQSAKEADGTKPEGTIYFLKNDDLRSRTRSPLFEGAVQELKKLEIQSEVVSGVVPKNKNQVAGAMLGKANINWGQSGSTLLPGAFCENLTSYGGILTEGHGHTVFREFLGYKAAGSSGTVVEPYAIVAKFPHPMFHVHYGRGATLGEAFYQSVASPFQQLLVGDYLCQPWATIPQVELEGLESGQTVYDKLTLAPKAITAQGEEINRFDIYLDGTLIARMAPGEKKILDLKNVASGHHELRIVAIDSSLLEVSGRLVIPFLLYKSELTEKEQTLDLQVDPKETIRWDEDLYVKVEAGEPEAIQEIRIYHRMRLLATIQGGSGESVLDPSMFGLGEVDLYAKAISKTTKKVSICSKPVTIRVTSTFPAEPTFTKKEIADLRDGLEFQQGSDGVKKVVMSTRSTQWFQEAGGKKGERFSLSGFVYVDRAGVYQFQAIYTGNLRASLNGEEIFSNSHFQNEMIYNSLPLAAGWHKLEISGILTKEPTDEEPAHFYFGQRGTLHLGSPLFRHLSL